MVFKIIFLVLIWVLPVVLLANAYVKMSKEEQEEFKGEFKNPLALITVGLFIIGLLLGITGAFLFMKLLQHIGVFMVFIGWFITVITGLRKGKSHVVKNVLLILIGLIGLTVYGYIGLN